MVRSRMPPGNRGDDVIGERQERRPAVAARCLLVKARIVWARTVRRMGTSLLVFMAALACSAEPVCLNGSGERLRRDAKFAPLPNFPVKVSVERRQGNVAVELVVRPSGVVGSIKTVSSFDEDAAVAVADALRTWQFVSIEKEPAGVRECGRGGRLVFMFTYESGIPVVKDLAAVRLPKGHVPGSSWPSLAPR